VFVQLPNCTTSSSQAQGERMSALEGMLLGFPSFP
jgi:hypothetical protein